MKDILKAGLGLNHVELAKMVANESVNVYQWLKQELGVEFQDVPPFIQMGGHSVPRSRIIKGNSGFGIVKKELDKLEAMGVPVRKQVLLSKLYQDEKGRVFGAMVREGYSFPRCGKRSGQEYPRQKGRGHGHGRFQPRFALPDHAGPPSGGRRQIQPTSREPREKA